MAGLSYKRRGLVLKKGGGDATERQIRDLQRDLRSLGYLRRGIDGILGNGTARAVRALQHDLLTNDGRSRSDDGDAPVRILDYNRGRVWNVTGEADQALVECISDILDDDGFPKLPSHENPVEANREIVSQISAMSSVEVPIPFLMAVLKQESGLKHFNEPGPGDEDTYIVVGLDTNSTHKHIITSRGYGAGQYTLFHHPPNPHEVQDFMLDVASNLRKGIWELRYKFDHFVNGATSGTRADDRRAEYGDGPLRLCKYDAGDARHMRDCKECAMQAGMQDIEAGQTRFHSETDNIFHPTQYYKKASYRSVPIRSNIGCDWPYAVRRYNGSGVNSYHYQVRVLKNLMAL